MHLKQCSQCSSGMSQLFMHGIHGLISGEIGGEDGGTGGLPSRLREEKVGMSFNIHSVQNNCCNHQFNKFNVIVGIL